MSRSRRKIPIAGNAVAPSDKPFKVMEHRRERRFVRSMLDEEFEPPSGKKFGNQWDAPKDGKHYFRRCPPSLMRK